jgi:AhpD family alkylhydroperoxidase
MAHASGTHTNKPAHNASHNRAAGLRRNVHKPTITTRDAVDAVSSLLAEFPKLYAIWKSHELDPAFREELMVAVARQNDAPYCNWAHRIWAEAEGATTSELAKIERLESRGLDRRKWVAVVYARTLVASEFKKVPRGLREELAAHYTPREIADIELVARVMDLVNRISNTFDAMLSRLQLAPGKDSRLLDEVVFSAVFLTAAPPILLYLARRSDRSSVEVMRSLAGFTQRFRAEHTRK